jgi:hypothetical protein
MCTFYIFKQFIFKSFFVLGQRCCSKNRGWPEPSKHAYLYENLLRNCPYKMFFDTETLCNPANAQSVRELSQMQDEEQAKSFFNATFRSGTIIIKALHYELIWLCMQQASPFSKIYLLVCIHFNFFFKK